MVSSLSNVFLLSEINFNLISFVLRVDKFIRKCYHYND